MKRSCTVEVLLPLTTKRSKSEEPTPLNPQNVIPQDFELDVSLGQSAAVLQSQVEPEEEIDYIHLKHVQDCQHLKLLPHEYADAHLVKVKPLNCGIDFLDECDKCEVWERRNRLRWTFRYSVTSVIDNIIENISSGKFVKYYVGITSSPSWRCGGGLTALGNEVTGHFGEDNRMAWHVMHVMFHVGCQQAKLLERFLISYFSVREPRWPAALRNSRSGGDGVSHAASEANLPFYIYRK